MNNVSSVLSATTDLSDMDTNFTVVNDYIVDNDAPWNHQDLTSKDDRGASTLQLGE